MLVDVLLKNFVAAADVLLKNFLVAAVFSVSYFSMLLKNFVAAYQSLREACAISGPCTSTRTWSVFHCSPYLSQLTCCGRIQNEPSSVAWRPLSQLTHCGLKILSRLTCFITFSLATILVSIIHVTVTKVSLAQSVSELHCN